MGVAGLTPFLQRTYPEVIKYLPERLKTIAGSRIIIDGTLITQRLHFVPLSHPYRHVLGWFRLVKELQEHNVSALCVFDGRERNIAKAKETLKRQEAKKLASAREVIENDRLKRLTDIGLLLNSLRALDAFGKSRVAGMIRDATHENEVPAILLPEYYVPTSGDVSEDDLQTDDTYPPLDYSLNDAPGQSASYISVEQIANNPDIAPIASECSIRSDYVPPIYTPTLPKQIIPPAPTLNEDIANSLISLYHDFRNSIPKLASLPVTPSSAALDDVEIRTEYIMSKGQYQLTLDEGQLWNRLGQEDKAVIEETLQALYDKSAFMSESYARRTHPPTVQTYTECKEILEAMGVPCIETEGPYEAEALASSLVLEGLADYVASEDTDVIVYDAPLLRNLTNRQVPLMVLSGPEIRKGLELSRDSFVDFALLLGTDFSQRIKNVGPARALKFIKAHGTIERILEAETKFPPKQNLEEYMDEVGVARTVFQTLPPIPEAARTAKGQKDDKKVRDIMIRHGLAKEVEWDHGNALTGNFFGDNPSTETDADFTTNEFYI